MRIPDLNPDTIPDLATHQVVIQLLKLIEAQVVDIAEVGQEHLVEGLLPASSLLTLPPAAWTSCH